MAPVLNFILFENNEELVIVDLTEINLSSLTSYYVDNDYSNVDYDIVLNGALIDIADYEESLTVGENVIEIKPYITYNEINYYASSIIKNITLEEPEENYTEGLLFTLNTDNVSYSVANGTATTKDIIIPSIYNSLPVTTIATSAFANKYLKSVVLPNTITKIQTSAFYNCSFTTLIIPASVTSISSNAFSGNSRLFLIEFLGAKPTTLSITSSFSNIFTYYYIKVQETFLNSYKTAFSSIADKFIVENYIIPSENLGNYSAFFDYGDPELNQTSYWELKTNSIIMEGFFNSCLIVNTDNGIFVYFIDYGGGTPETTLYKINIVNSNSFIIELFDEGEFYDMATYTKTV